MGSADEFKYVDAPDVDADETELTEEEFDARMAAGEPVLVTGVGALRERFEDYYSLQITQPGTVAISAGRWGGERVSSAAADRDAQLFSAV
jgi:hypothetical protein